ncbi:MAG TPA: 16S rRNA (guanine(966)-N(2))-methyltransferase RsmD [Verrucomicrobiae bacterium]|nr:16S rRNA (guanine(966)-N(2))-methyltransferase RsmD [Verrucomicrobiae bacterium]
MKRPSGKLRIIGGDYRSRVVAFDPDTGVRPTPDRVRQTLFDWLAPLIEGARALDLFAGSGALGLEALSRGAAHVTFVETGRGQCDRIREALGTLKCAERAAVEPSDALGVLGRPLTPAHSPRAGRGSYDIAFLDPPFDANLLAPALAALPRVLKPGARVYVERHHGGAFAWPAGYTVIREKQAGQVSYALATHSPENA